MSEKILIVDDEPEIADLVSLYLQNENFTVYKFYSAIEALNCIGHEKLDMAILCRGNFFSGAGGREWGGR